MYNYFDQMNLRKTTASGILTIGAARIVQQPISLVITAILARLLSPKDFGLIGIVAIFTSFISVFAYLGLGSAIIQKKDIKETQLSTLFWIGLIFGVFSALLLVLSSYPISLFYKEPQLIKLISALSINFCISPFYQINRKLLEKNLRFRAIAIREITSSVLSGLVGIAAAFLKFGVWSLVLQSISFNLISLILFQIVQKWSPKFVFDFKDCKEMIRFGLHIVGAYFAGYLERNIDFFFIGKLFGSTTLGFYSLAYRIMYFPVRQVSNIFLDVLYPTFSKIQDNIKSIQKGYLDSIKYISAVTFPLMTLVLLVSDKVILLAFGIRWIMTSQVLKILAPAGAIYSVWQVSWAVLPAIGKAKLRMKLGFLQSILLTLGIILGNHWGFSGVIYGISSSAILIWLISQIYLNKLLNLSFISVFLNLRSSLIACIALAMTKLIMILIKIPNLGRELYNFLLEIVVYFIVYSIIMFTLFRKEIKSLLQLYIRKSLSIEYDPGSSFPKLDK